MLRHIYDYSQAQMAKLCGISIKTLNDIEQFHVSFLRQSLFEKTAESFQMAPIDLFRPLDVYRHLNVAGKGSRHALPGESNGAAPTSPGGTAAAWAALAAPARRAVFGPPAKIALGA